MEITRRFPVGTVHAPAFRAGEGEGQGSSGAPPAAGQGSGGANGGGTPPAAGNSEAYNKVVTDNARYRERFRSVREILGIGEDGDIVDAVRKLKPSGSPSGGDRHEDGGNGEGGPVTLASLRRDLENERAERRKLQSTLEAKENKGRQKILTAELTRIAAASRLVEPDAAVEILAGRAEVDADDAVVFRIPDPEAENGFRRVKATPEALREHAKALRFPASFFPAEGKGGSGTGAPGESAGGNALDNLDPSTYARDDKARDAARAAWFGQNRR